MNLSVPLPSLIGGVSQQVKALRRPSQCSELINGWPSPVEGLTKRPASHFIRDMLATSAANMLGYHLINQSPTERFFILASNAPALHATSITASDDQTWAAIPGSFGSSPPVVPATNFDYLIGASLGDLRFLTIQDYTFVVNRKVPVAMLADLTPADSGAYSGHAYLYIKQGANDTNYNLTLKRSSGSPTVFVTSIPTWDNTGASPSAVAFQLEINTIPAVGVTVRVTVAGTACNHVVIIGDTPTTVAYALRRTIEAVNNVGARGSGSTIKIFQTSNTTTPTITDSSTLYVTYSASATVDQMLATTNAEDVAAEFASRITSHGVWTAARVGAVVRISGADDFIQFDWSDSLASTAMVAMNREVETQDDLPPICTDGYVVKVSSVKSDTADDYYVKFVCNETGQFGRGTWVESVKPGITYKLDPETLPHQLVWNGSDFDFGPAAWEERLVGDDESARDPSIVGQTINDLFFLQGRLGFVAGPNVVMSETNRYFNLFRTTVRQILDSDPIDAAVQDAFETNIQHAVTWDNQAILFSANSQFAVGGEPLLTPKSFASKVIGRWECSSVARPLLVQNSMLFACEVGGYTRLWELYRQGDTDFFNAADITAEVPKYIAGAPIHMSLSPMEQAVAVQTDSSEHIVYLYKFFMQGNEKAQSAWCKVEFDNTVGYAGFLDSQLFIAKDREISFGGGSPRLAALSLEFSAEQIDPSSSWSVRLDQKIHSDRFGTITYDALNNETEILLPLDIDSTFGGLVVAVTAASGTQEAGEAITVVGTNSAAPDTYGGHSITLAGDWRTEPFWVGIPFGFLYQFSQPTLHVLEDNAYRTLRDGLWRVDRGVLEYENSGHVEVTTSLPGRDDSTLVWNDWSPGDWDLNTYFGESGVIHFPVLGLADEAEVVVQSDSWLPLTLVSAEWHGFYTSRVGRLR